MTLYNLSLAKYVLVFKAPKGCSFLLTLVMLKLAARLFVPKYVSL